ncbi:MAG: hypothetical protein AAF564_25040 [Bacteroidota bacterium]
MLRIPFVRRTLFVCGFVLFFLIGATTKTNAQEMVYTGYSAGVSLQAYPAGIIGTARLSYQPGIKHVFSGYGGFNTTDRRDWGKHDDESGSGAGFGLAWHYYFNIAPAGFYAGIRTDLWFLAIDWRENNGATGTTDITVLQPTAQLGYTFLPGEGTWFFDANVALGAEINIETEGEDVGEGAILLIGIGVGYRF